MNETDTAKGSGSRAFFACYVYPNRYILVLAAALIGAGVVFAHAYFPRLSSLQATAGGIVLGLFATLCSACHSIVWQPPPTTSGDLLEPPNPADEPSGPSEHACQAETDDSDLDAEGVRR